MFNRNHLKDHEIENVSMPYSTLGAKFCIKNMRQGGTCIFVHESLDYNLIDLQKYCVEQEIEICAIRMVVATTNIYVISIYRSPTGDFATFIQVIHEILN